MEVFTFEELERMWERVQEEVKAGRLIDIKDEKAADNYFAELYFKSLYGCNDN